MSTKASSQQSGSFKPYVASNSKMTEFSLRATILGILLGVVFCIGNAYLGLKVGTTISASIPAAVMSMAILRTFFKNVTILENNIVQTVAAVAEGLAAGVIFTIPALFLLNDSPSIWKIFLLAFLGGVLGVLFMIPMRRYIIVKEHGKLPFPEGTACAAILESGEKSGDASAKPAIWGFVLGGVYKFIMSGLNLWKETFTVSVKAIHSVVAIDCTPALLGVGYIIGLRIASIMFAGGVLGWWVLIPVIKQFAGHAVIYPANQYIDLMTPTEIWSNYIRYIGAGCVATGGLFSMFQIAPLIKKTVFVGFKELFATFSSKRKRPRVDQDVSMKWLILGPVAIIATLALVPELNLNVITISLLVLLAYFFVAVTSITVGLVGSSSNPVSGMTITTLLIISFVFYALGWTERVFLISAITASCVANVAIALASTTSQDLKTGYLLGATPKYQQVAEIIGLVLPSLVIGGTLYLLNEAYHFGSAQLPAPQATLMTLIAKGVLQQQLPTTLVTMGVILGVVLQLMRVPVLAFAIGLYLPLSLSSPIMLGGVMRAIVKRIKNNKENAQEGVLGASGLVAGDACMGVLIALLTVLGFVNPLAKPYFHTVVGLVVFLCLGFFLYFSSSLKKRVPLRKSKR